MGSQANPQFKSSFWKVTGVPLLVLCVGLLNTWHFTMQAHNLELRQQTNDFNILAARQIDEIKRRISGYEYSLTGVRALFSSSRSVERAEFRKYIAEISQANTLNGLLGLGYVEKVGKQDLEKFISAQKRDDAPQFDVNSDGHPEELLIVKFFESATGDSQELGLDLGTIQEIRKTAETAAQANLASVTPVLATPNPLSNFDGLLYLLPVYRQDSQPLSEAERTAATMGWVYAAVLPDQAFLDIEAQTQGQLNLKIFDGSNPSPANLLFDLDQHFSRNNPAFKETRYTEGNFKRIENIKVGGRTWTVRTSSTAEFDNQHNSNALNFLAGLGVLVSLLLAQWISMLLRTRALASQVAARMTVDLEKSRDAEQWARVEAEEALVRLNCYKAVIDQHAIVAVTDCKGIIQYVNDLFCDVSGYSHQDLIGSDHALINSNFHPKEFWSELWNAVTSGQVWHGEICNRHKNGRLYWERATIMPIRNAKGQIMQFVEVKSDITELKETEHNLKDQKQRLDLAVSGGDLGLWDWQLETDEIIVNERWAIMLGLPLTSLEQTKESWYKLIHPDDLEQVKKAVALNITGLQNFYDCTYRMQHTDGSWRWILAHGKVVKRNSDEDALRMVGTHLDITERVGVMEQLQTANQLLEQSADLGKMGGWEIDILNRKVTFSRAVFAIHEIDESHQPSLEEAISFYAPEARATITTAVTKGMQSGTGWDLNLPFITAKGRKLWVRTVGQPVMRHGRCEKLIGVFQDITTQKEIEDNLQRANEAAENASRAKSEFLARMSHEIRTPMNAIMGMTQLALEGELNADQRDLLNCVDSAAGSLLVIINDILDLSKIESGHLELVPSDFNIRELVNQTLAQLRVKAINKGIGLLCEVDANIPQILRGDDVRLRQILINLVGNALKFTDPEGVVILQINLLQDSDADLSLHFCVSDTGVGITEEARRHIFEAFTQADGSITRRFGGTGLGLSISKQLVTLMGGEIWVESSLGQGSAFQFTVKLQRTNATRATAEPGPYSGALTKSRVSDLHLPESTVLLVEDNLMNQKLAVRLLARFGIQVHVANNGCEAVQILEETPSGFDLIFMDCQMPVMGGLEATARIRSLEDGNRHVPIVAMTANAMTGDREACLEAGMDEYLTKPIDRAKLEALLRRYLGNKNQEVIPDNQHIETIN